MAPSFWPKHGCCRWWQFSTQSMAQYGIGLLHRNLLQSPLCCWWCSTPLSAFDCERYLVMLFQKCSSFEKCGMTQGIRVEDGMPKEKPWKRIAEKRKMLPSIMWDDNDVGFVCQHKHRHIILAFPLTASWWLFSHVNQYCTVLYTLRLWYFKMAVSDPRV